MHCYLVLCTSSLARTLLRVFNNTASVRSEHATGSQQAKQGRGYIRTIAPYSSMGISVPFRIRPDGTGFRLPFAETGQIRTKVNCSPICMYLLRVANQASGIRCIFDPGSQIRNRFFPGSRISDPKPIFESLITLF
jgi:hypothetical protein